MGYSYMSVGKKCIHAWGDSPKRHSGLILSGVAYSGLLGFCSVKEKVHRLTGQVKTRVEYLISCFITSKNIFRVSFIHGRDDRYP